MNFMNSKNSFLIVALLLTIQVEAKPVRLENFGSTCYLNSTVQSLYNIDVITNFALFTYRIDPYPPGSLASLYLKLVHAMNNLQLLPENSAGYAQAEQKFWNNELTNFVQKAYQVMDGCGQQDAPEFFVKLVDSLVSQDKRYSAKTPQEQLRTHPLGKNIKIEIATTVNCPTVKYKNTTQTPSPNLNIEMSKPLADGSLQLFTSLEQGLDNFFVPEKLDEYTPEGKPLQHDCTKQFELAALSDVVIIVPKRYAFDFMTGEQRKLDQAVTTPLTMNFRKYFTANAKNTKMYNYDLIAAAQHMGTTLGGHYVAHIKDIKSGQWYYCSDTTIQTQTKEAAQNGINNSYILVYRKNEKS